MRGRDHRRLDAEIELLGDNILLAGDRGDLASVPALEQTLRYLKSQRAAQAEGRPLIIHPRSQAVLDVLKLIRGPVEFRVTPGRKSKRSAKPPRPPPSSGGPGGAGTPGSPCTSSKQPLRRKG